MSEKIELKITGMSCEHCVMRVKKAAEGVEGVSNVSVDLASGVLTAEADAKEKIDAIKAAVNDAGYQAS